MATQTISAVNFLTTYLNNNDISISSLEKYILSGRLERVFDAAGDKLPSTIKIVVALAGAKSIRENAATSNTQDIISSLAYQVSETIDTLKTPEANGDDDNTGVVENLLSKAQHLSYKNTGISQIANQNTKYVSALTTDNIWSKSTLTYSFNTSIPSEYRGSTGDTDLTANWRPLTQNEKNNVRKIFTQINTHIGINIQEAQGQSEGDFRLNAIDYNTSASAFAYYPSSTALGGDIFLNRLYYDDASNFTQGDFLYEAILHEVGHALGLKHPFDGIPNLPVTVDNTSNSLMSYTSKHYIVPELNWNAAEKSIQLNYTSNAYHTDFALLDIQALHSLYGANTQYKKGNNTYTVEDGEYLSIWDAGGHDTIDLSQKHGNSQIDLRPGTLSSANIQTIENIANKLVNNVRLQNAPVTSSWPFDFVVGALSELGDKLYNGTNNIAIPLGVLIEDVKTGNGNDIIWDNAVDNAIYTGAGNDNIYLGRGGFDYVDGGTGYDKVHFTVSSTAVEIGQGDNQSIIVVANNFAAQLVGVEELVFTNKIIYSADLLA